METTYEISFEVVKGGFVNLVVTRKTGDQADLWGGCLEKGADLNAPLPCMFADEPGIVPILIAEDVKAAILAKWAELEAPEAPEA